MSNDKEDGLIDPFETNKSDYSDYSSEGNSPLFNEMIEQTKEYKKAEEYLIQYISRIPSIKKEGSKKDKHELFAQFMKLYQINALVFHPVTDQLLSVGSVSFRGKGTQFRHVTPVIWIERAFFSRLKPGMGYNETMKAIFTLLEPLIESNKESKQNTLIQSIFDYFKSPNAIKASMDVEFLIKLAMHCYNNKTFSVSTTDKHIKLIEPHQCRLVPKLENDKNQIIHNSEGTLVKAYLKILEQYHSPIVIGGVKEKEQNAKKLNDQDIAIISYSMYSLFDYIPLVSGIMKSTKPAAENDRHLGESVDRLYSYASLHLTVFFMNYPAFEEYIHEKVINKFLQYVTNGITQNDFTEMGLSDSYIKGKVKTINAYNALLTPGFNAQYKFEGFETYFKQKVAELLETKKMGEKALPSDFEFSSESDSASDHYYDSNSGSSHDDHSDSNAVDDEQGHDSGSSHSDYSGSDAVDDEQSSGSDFHDNYYSTSDTDNELNSDSDSGAADELADDSSSQLDNIVELDSKHNIDARDDGKNIVNQNEGLQYQYLLQSDDINYVGMEFYHDDPNNFFLPVQQDTGGLLTSLADSKDASIEQLSAGKRVVSVLNKDGNHWVSFMLAKIDDQLFFYYKDSLALPIPQALKDYAYDIAVQIDADLVSIRPNNNIEQRDNELFNNQGLVHCGIFAIENMKILSSLTNEQIQARTKPQYYNPSQQLDVQDGLTEADRYQRNIIAKREDAAGLYIQHQVRMAGDQGDRVKNINAEIANLHRLLPKIPNVMDYDYDNTPTEILLGEIVFYLNKKYKINIEKFDVRTSPDDPTKIKVYVKGLDDGFKKQLTDNSVIARIGDNGFTILKLAAMQNLIAIDKHAWEVENEDHARVVRQRTHSGYIINPQEDAVHDAKHTITYPLHSTGSYKWSHLFDGETPLEPIPNLPAKSTPKLEEHPSPQASGDEDEGRYIHSKADQRKNAFRK